MNSHPCSVCGEGGHHSRRCPTLCSPLQPGFYAPPAGHRPSEDDEDEKANQKPVYPVLGFMKKQETSKTVEGIPCKPRM